MNIQFVTPFLGVELYNGFAKVSSLHVAQVFDKRHADVLRAIENLECSDEFTQRNFALSEYTDPTGRKLPQYLMTRDGFTILAMGFNGKEAMQFKEAYIKRFNEYEQMLQEMFARNLVNTLTGKRTHKSSKPQRPDPLTLENKIMELFRQARKPLSVRDLCRKTNATADDIRLRIHLLVENGMAVVVPAVIRKEGRGRPTIDKYIMARVKTLSLN